jgi:hypothetical protein
LKHLGMHRVEGRAFRFQSRKRVDLSIARQALARLLIRLFAWQANGYTATGIPQVWLPGF